jgi:hypothetical protein
MSRLVDATAPEDIHERPLEKRQDMCKAKSWSQYFHEFHYKGGNPTYRPFKIADLDEWWSVVKCVCTGIFSILPVIAGFAGAYPILFYAVPSKYPSRPLLLHAHVKSTKDAL